MGVNLDEKESNDIRRNLASWVQEIFNWTMVIIPIICRLQKAVAYLMLKPIVKRFPFYKNTDFYRNYDQDRIHLHNSISEVNTEILFLITLIYNIHHISL